jgi:hypothetical protein
MIYIKYTSVVQYISTCTYYIICQGEGIYLPKVGILIQLYVYVKLNMYSFCC